MFHSIDIVNYYVPLIKDYSYSLLKPHILSTVLTVAQLILLDPSQIRTDNR